MARGSGRRLENGLGGPCPCRDLKHTTVGSSMDQRQCCYTGGRNINPGPLAAMLKYPTETIGVTLTSRCQTFKF